MMETQALEYKSLKKVVGRTADLKKLAETCVCLANAQGGQLVVGIEDKEKEPPAKQKVLQEDINKVISSLRSLTDGVGMTHTDVQRHENGGEFFTLTIFPSTRTIATTSSGKVFIRISDNCFPVGSEELTDLAAEKTAFQWEIIAPHKTRLEQADAEKRSNFIRDLKASDKVSDFIKQKEETEILEFYQLLSPEGFLTNLGVLWLGTPAQRARLSYPLTVQYIVYNEREEKIRKVNWHFHQYNPKELLLEIEREAVELTYSSEFPDGLFRKSIRHYPKEVIRELLINAIAHKKYTISGDIFIEVFHDRLTITSPGGFPLGITRNNILHQRQRRNPHLIQVLHDLKLMEGEGSGYDLVFEKLARDAKPLPEIENDYSRVSISIMAGTAAPETISILDYIGKHFNLTQKEYITLGIIAAEKKVSATQLSKKLQLSSTDKSRSWIGTLLQNGIVVTQGEKKGTEYLLNPELFAQAQLGITPSLKTIEPYKLEALIIEDLKYNGESKLSDIQERLKEVPADDIKKAVYRMTEQQVLFPQGGKRNRSYALSKKK